MGLAQAVLIGHANGDVHNIATVGREEVSQVATREALSLGKLSNSGFRTIVAAVWFQDETKTAGLSYVAAWVDNEVLILLHDGDRIASSHNLYKRCRDAEEGNPLTSPELAAFCKLAKI